MSLVKSLTRRPSLHRFAIGRKWARNNSTLTKPLYLTTPIFYVNASPHLGHLYSMLLCDTRTRWEKLNPQKNAFFLTGTDEHGLKIQEVAVRRGMEPKALVDEVSRNFKVLAQKLNIDYNRFIRTTDPDHVDAVRFFWTLMESKGLIYQGSHSGWYSVSDETFYPENQIEIVLDSKSGKEIKRSKETRNEVFYHEETNYFFKLSQFQSRLIEFLESNPSFIRPAAKYHEVLNELKEAPLSDLSISRPSSRLSWAIEVPNDASQRMYVWFDALINYITAAGFPHKFEFDKSSQKFVTPSENIWPATHIIGKDIVRFHCIYWPIFLMAAGVELPKQVIVHSHWLSDGFKMSKSLGNVVDPIDTYEYYGQDALRFFLTENSNIENDCNYSERAFYNTRENLIGKYANLATRCGGAAFDIEGSIRAFSDGKFANIDDLIESRSLNQNHEKEVKQIVQLHKQLTQNLNNLYKVMNEKFEAFDQMKAIQCWWTVLEQANLVFQLGQPWLYTKALKDDSVSQDIKSEYQILQHFYVFMAAETSRITSILISPVMPELATSLLDRLGVSTSKRTMDDCVVGADTQYGTGANSKKHKVPIQRVPIRESS